MPRPKYKSKNHNQINIYIDELIETRKEFSRVCLVPLNEMCPIEKEATLKKLDEYESFVLRKLCSEKGLLVPSVN